MTSTLIQSFSDNYSWLSNFYQSPITDKEGITYATVEHYFQAQKTTNVQERVYIATADTPAAAKRVGRAVVLRDDWETIKLAVMRHGLSLKFPNSANPLGVKLLLTGSAMLIEGNTWGDTYWGRCNNRGQNWLGHLLMARRAELAAL